MTETAIATIAPVTAAQAHAAGQSLSQAFNRIRQTRMAGLPFLNPALQVEAVGFRPWQSRIVGVLLTPWAMNLVVLPGNDGSFRSLGADVQQTWAFPSGDYEFMGGEEVECGPFHFCSLFSPMADFADQTMARTTAEAALEALFVQDEESLAKHREQQRQAAQLEGKPAPLSRRGFLTGGRSA
ncbi:MAG TPA: [NiFe]-hydrogenase assembly chaperone HybE [Rhodocyclaceae bacterium]|nr:[NiFe]-hydrogenase assembly chaperone HybE [Rhodocyclaceae bacterium]